MRRALGWLLVVLGVLTLAFIVLAVVIELAQGETDGLGVLTLVVVPALLLAVGRGLLAPRARVTTPTPHNRATDQVRYLQRWCQVPLRGSLVALLLGPGVLVVSALVPVGWLQSLLIVVGVVPLVYLLGVVIYLPYAIRVGEHTLTIGVRGVPRFGRGWRRVTMPLTEVLEWRSCRASRTLATRA